MAHHIRKRFSDQKNTLDLLMAKDPEFRSLCEDYDSCVDALHHWARSKTPEAEMRVKEYRHLCQELEKEVAEVIKESRAK